MRTQFVVSALFLAAFACGGTSSSTTLAPDSGTPGTDASTPALDAGDAASQPDVNVPCTDCVTGSLSWGDTGGLVIYFDTSSLASCRTYTRIRHLNSDGGTLSCTTEVGACAAAPVAIGDVEHALAHPDVVAAFAKPTTPVYGNDSRPVDGSILEITKDGKSIDVGGDCGTSSAPACVPIPPGISALASVLRALDTQELAKPACAALN